MTVKGGWGGEETMRRRREPGGECRDMPYKQKRECVKE